MSEYDEHDDVAPVEPETERVGADQDAPAADHARPADGWEAPTTGLSSVDDVLVSVQDLDGRPVEDHVAVFEQAHERLRRALDARHG